MHLTKKQKRVQNMLENNSNTFGHITWTWKPILNLRHISKNSRNLRPLLFPPYEILVRPIQIQKSKIFQRVFGGFTEFLCSSDSNIQTAWDAWKSHRVEKESIDFKKAEDKCMGDFAYSIWRCLSLH